MLQAIFPENTEVAEDHALYFESGMKEICEAFGGSAGASGTDGRKHIRKNADFICGKYNWDRVTEQTLHLYQHVLKARENQK
ncbi:MAG: hypothetical protein ACLU3U_01545 [Gallintestinimicrobium sp.]